MKRLIVAFVQFAHDGNDEEGPLATCHNAICRWAARLADTQLSNPDVHS